MQKLLHESRLARVPKGQDPMIANITQAVKDHNIPTKLCVQEEGAAIYGQLMRRQQHWQIGFVSLTSGHGIYLLQPSMKGCSTASSEA